MQFLLHLSLYIYVHTGFSVTVMPRIRCPNCGTSINLETRRELDYKMILKGMQRGSQTFTDLLKLTGLPRKTLSLRLTALCDSGVVVKDGGYCLNESMQPEKWGKILNLTENKLLTKSSFFTKRSMLLMLMLLVIGVPIAANVAAMLFSSPPPSPPSAVPQYIGTFNAHVKVYNVTDLFAWEAVIYANSSELIVIDAVEGNFLKSSAPQGTTFLFADEMTNPHTPNIVLIGDSLLGMDVPGVSGTGTLAIITFGYKSEHYAPPKIIFDHNVHETVFLDSNLALIQEYTLTIELEV